MQFDIMFAHGQQGLLSMMVLVIVAGCGGVFSLGGALGSLAKKTEEGNRTARKLIALMVACFGIGVLSPLIIQWFGLP